MKKGIFFLFLISVRLAVFSQLNANTEINKQIITTGNTYAVVIGIANYENENINLNYANRDAIEFANFLQSNSGGAVPAENIRLLTDTNATTAAIYNAFTWLKDKCEDDKMENKDKSNLVYFYYSGHGDVETDTKANLGFLLAFNTPKNNYLNNAVRIEDLNNYAHTLSIDLNASVVIITDACHSGKMAGSDNRGTYLVGKELIKAKDKEIRIASCYPDQLSNEDMRWGGGRGVFSWYLINGLKGLADKNADGIITLDEIKIFVDSCIANDPIIKANNYKQTPVLQGKQQFKLASVNKEELSSLQTSMSRDVPVLSDQEYFFNLLKKDDQIDHVDYEKLKTLSGSEIPLAFIHEIKRILDTAETKIPQFLNLENAIKQDSEQLYQFKQSLVEALHTRGQKIINLYLAGDAAELERRRYYNSRNNGYDVYPLMYSLAIKLSKEDDPFIQSLRINQLYFEAVAARLKIPTVEESEQNKLIDDALAALQKAKNITDADHQAAYIHNELGVLNQYKKQNAEAEKYLINATILAPEWAVPWGNLTGLYANTNAFEKGIDAADKAKILNPDLECIYVNSGYLYELKGNQLIAEELYRKSIHINSRHYSPFERLGYVHMNTTRYALADSFFYEAELRKMGFHFIPGVAMLDLEATTPSISAPLFCRVESNDVKINDVLGHFALGIIASGSFGPVTADGLLFIDRRGGNISQTDMEIAEKEFKKVIELDKTNPLAFHYLGRILYWQKRWAEAEIILNLALQYHLDETRFSRYLDSMGRLLPNTKSKSCIVNNFSNFYYPILDNHYFLAALYEKWNHYSEAEIQYRTIISIDTISIAGYYKLWTLLEKIGRYKDAEEIIRKYMANNPDKKAGEQELYAFYKRMLDIYPDDADWNYKTGIFLYHLAADNPGDYLHDYKTVTPDTYEENFISRAHEDFKIFTIKCMDETHRNASVIDLPRNEGIFYLLKADSLSTFSENEIADINDKLGDLYTWQGLAEKAIPHYKKSIDFHSSNASVRHKLVEVNDASYHFQDAQVQLDSLNNRREINFQKMLLMAKYLIHSGKFEDAKQLLAGAEKIHPYKIPEIIDLNGRLLLLSGHEKEAMGFYKKLLELNSNNNGLDYTMARLFASQGNIAEAWKWLETAAKNGFNFAYVLQFDKYMDNLRKTKKWDPFMQRINKDRSHYPKMNQNKFGGY